MKMAALLDGDGIGLLGEWFSDLCEVTVVIKLIFYFTRVVDKRELSSEVGENSLESLLRGVDHSRVLNHFVQVGVLLSYWIVPERQGWAQQQFFKFIFVRNNFILLSRQSLNIPDSISRVKEDLSKTLLV